MFTRRNLLSLALGLAATVLVAGQASPSMAVQKGGNSLRLIARMSAGATKATAKYEVKNTRRKFTFELEKGTPGTIITVQHKGVTLATRQIDSLGRAKIDWDTNIGSSIPNMASGDVISVWVGSTQLMSGTLR